MDNQNNGVNLQKEKTAGLPVGEVLVECYPGAPVNTTSAQSLPVNTPVYADPQVPAANISTAVQSPAVDNTKFCKFCGSRVPIDAVLCTSCGRQIEQLQGVTSQPQQIIINNANNNAVGGVPNGRLKNKWVCFWLWLFLGLFGGHKFYEEKTGAGIFYLFTAGGFLIGWFIDLFVILGRPNPYYV